MQKAQRPREISIAVWNRIIYSIQDSELTVWVVKIGHRKNVYD